MMKPLKNFSIASTRILALTTGLLATHTGWGQNVSYRVNLSPVGSFQSESEKLEGSASQSGETYTVENATIVIDTFKTGVDLRDEHMKKKYFEMEKFPTAKLVKAEGSNGKFKGSLEVHGVVKDIEGTFEVADSKLKAKFTTKMSEFGIPKATYMGIGAKDVIAVEVSLPIKKKTASN